MGHDGCKGVANTCSFSGGRGEEASEIEVSSTLSADVGGVTSIASDGIGTAVWNVPSDEVEDGRIAAGTDDGSTRTLKTRDNGSTVAGRTIDGGSNLRCGKGIGSGAMIRLLLRHCGGALEGSVPVRGRSWFRLFISLTHSGYALSAEDCACRMSVLSVIRGIEEDDELQSTHEGRSRDVDICQRSNRCPLRVCDVS